MNVGQERFRSVIGGGPTISDAYNGGRITTGLCDFLGRKSERSLGFTQDDFTAIISQERVETELGLSAYVLVTWVQGHLIRMKRLEK